MENKNKPISILIKSILSNDTETMRDELRNFQLRLPRINLKNDSVKQYSEEMSKLERYLMKKPETEQKTLQENIDIFKTLVNVIAYGFYATKVVNYATSLLDSIKTINDTERKYIKYAAILLTYKWTPASRLSLPYIDNILALYSSGLDNKEKEKQICNQIYKFYNKKELNQILSIWLTKKIVKDRRKIFKAIFNAHISGNYTLSVPALISQIEGIVARTFYHKGQMHEPCYKAYINEILSMDSNLHYDNIAVNFFISMMLVSFNHGESINSSISRHAILHGADTQYGTRENSLKLILFLDYILSKLGYFAYKNSKTIHEIGCKRIHSISRSEEATLPADLASYFTIIKKGKAVYYKKQMTIFKNIEEPLENGYFPCKDCLRQANIS